MVLAPVVLLAAVETRDAVVTRGRWQFHFQALAGLAAIVPLAVSTSAARRQTVPGGARTSPAT